MLVVSFASNPVQMGLPPWAPKIWHENALCPQTHLCNLSQIWRSTPRTHLTDETKPGPGNCILESKTLLMEQTTDPMRLCSGKQRLPFSPLSLSSQIGQRGSGLPLAPWALLVCWWSPELQTHSRWVCLHGHPRFGMKMPCFHRPHLCNLRQIGRPTPRTQPQATQNQVLVPVR